MMNGSGDGGLSSTHILSAKGSIYIELSLV